MRENLQYTKSRYMHKSYALIVKNKLKKVFSLDGFSKLVFYGLLGLLVCTPFVVSHELRFGVVKGKDFWVKGIALLLLLYFILVNLFSKRQKTLQFNAVDLALLAFLGYSTAYILLQDAVLLYLEVYALQVTMLFIYGILRWYFSRISKQELYFLMGFIAIFLVLVSMGQTVVCLLQLFGEDSSYNGYFKMTGSFANPAPLAFLLALSIPVSLSLVLGLDRLQELAVPKVEYPNRNAFLRKRGKQFIKFLCGLNLILAFMLLALLHIRTGWLMALAGSAVVVALLYQRHIFLLVRKIGLWLRLACAILLLGVCLGGYYLKKGSADGRLFIYEVTLDKILERPFVGQGYNGFYANYNRWQGEWFNNHLEEPVGDKAFLAGNVTMAYNTYLETWVNLGLLGLCLFLLPLVVLFHKLIKTQKSLQEPTFKKLFILGLSGVLIALLVGALTYTPLEDSVGKLWYFISLACLASLLPLRQWRIVMRTRLAQLRLPVFTAGFALVVMVTVYQYRLYRDFKAWEEDRYWLTTGTYAQAVDYYTPLYPTLKHEHLFIQEYAKALALNGQPKESIRVLEAGEAYGTDVFASITLGDSHRALKDYNAAENAYTEAVFMHPGMFYPRYLLVNLYREWGEVDKAKTEAEKCLQLPVKVASPAIDQMKNELNAFLTENHQPLKERRVVIEE